MRLSHLLKNIYSIPASIDCEIMRLQLDSRLVAKQDLFFALPGSQVDGRQYIAEAIARGAVAVLADSVQRDVPLSFHENIPIIPIYELKKTSAFLAARFYDYPAQKLRLIGVTGTSGKTSCTHFIAQLLHPPCGLIGTLGTGFYGVLKETGLTTPDSLALQKHLHEFVEQGVETVAMEVSSHSIDQERIRGIPFEIGIFTNLTQDHLDYHGDLASYAAVKHRFIAAAETKHVIINADDSYGQKWLAELAEKKSVFAFSTHQSAVVPAHIPHIYSDHVALTLQGISAEIVTPWGRGQVTVPLIGQFNLSNLLASVAALSVLGMPFADILNRLSTLQSVPGRMQTLGGQDKPLVIIDYAHKPDALEKVLQTLRMHVSGKLICVFGCGGDRDRSKRPLMGQIAERLADIVIVTNDNPRHENPEDIAAEILTGFSHPKRAITQLDRSKAIEKSIQCASANDCVLIAGKGAEHYQQIGKEKVLFDDVEEARKYLGV